MSELHKALVKAQSEMKNPPLDGNNPHFKSKFSTLKATLAAIVPALNKNGLAMVQKPVMNECGLALQTVLVHKDGEEMDCGTLFIPVANGNPQSFVAALTYARRASALSVASLCGDEDDDGNAAAKTEGRVKAEKKESKITAAEINFRKSCQEAKKLIGEAGYYEVLGGMGFAKSSEVGNKEDRANVLTALRAYYEMNKDD